MTKLDRSRTKLEEFQTNDTRDDSIQWFEPVNSVAHCSCWVPPINPYGVNQVSDPYRATSSPASNPARRCAHAAWSTSWVKCPPYQITTSRSLIARHWPSGRYQLRTATPLRPRRRRSHRRDNAKSRKGTGSLFTLFGPAATRATRSGLNCRTKTRMHWWSI